MSVSPCLQKVLVKSCFCVFYVAGDGGISWGDSESYHINFDGRAPEPGKCPYLHIQVPKVNHFTQYMKRNH